MVARFLISLLACALAACAAVPSAPLATGAVSSADPRASAAGEAMLARGGSATDAAIAVMLALTVVEPQSSGIGGGGFMVASDAAGTVTTIDGRETAPAIAEPDWFLDQNGEPMGFREAVLSGRSVGVPGNVALAALAHRRGGKLPWSELFAPAIALARDGFRVNPRLNSYLTEQSDRAANDPYAQATFYDEAGAALPVGALVTNPELAETLQRIAGAGPDGFYQGLHADLLALTVRSATPGNAGMRREDVEGYEARPRAPVCTVYRAHRICGMGPPSSGAVAVAQMLGLLERFDLAALGPDSPTFWHLFLEAQRLAYADRELYIADPDFVAVPVAQLLDPAYLGRRSALIAPDRSLDGIVAGRFAGYLRADGHEAPETGTSHFAIADAAGNVVSYTSTIEGAFGSGLLYGGFYLNNELTDFSFVPQVDGMPVANRVEGGKRPRSSMAPTIVFAPDGSVRLVIGAAGGSTIPVQVARGIIGVIDFGLPAEQALGLPLIMQFGERTLVEDGSALIRMIPALEALGHGGIAPGSPPLKANALDRVDGRWIPAVDPRLVPQLVIPDAGS